jgi:CDP-diacylglycerol--glycerol-3-phosphate 3-phosphatidyltransferase/cardiolipin synthase
MGRYRARDLLLVPSLVSLVRVPLAAAFPFAVDLPWLALALLVAAGVSDLLDGWLARRHGQATATGAVVDPITDKLFVATVMVTLLVTRRLGLLDLVLLSTRELGELPLVAWWAVSRRHRRRRAESPKANLPGKLATALQFFAVTLALLRAPHTRLAVIVAGAAGLAAAISYWSLELRAERATRRRAAPR